MKRHIRQTLLCAGLIAALGAAARAQEPPIGPIPLTPAGRIPRQLTAYVTGSETPKQIFMPLVYRTISRAASVEPGAGMVVAYNKVVAPSTIKQGESKSITVPVSFWGPGLQTVQTDVRVMVNNVRLGGFDGGTRLYVSNNPEAISRPGTLLAGSAERFENIRFLYHHKNISARPMVFAFHVENVSSETVRIQMVEGEPQVSIREGAAGHRAAAHFVKTLKNNVGRILEIPPGTDGPAFTVPCDNNAVISGVFEMRVLEGPGAIFALKVRRADAPDDNKGVEIGESNGSRGHGEFPTAHINIEDDFVVGGQWTFIGVGDRAMSGSSGSISPLAGNYGVTYNIKVNISNPHDKSERVDINLAPTAGPMSGLLYIDGERLEIPYARPPAKVLIRTFMMPPRSQRVVNIETMPESGSNYPVRIVFGARRIL